METALFLRALMGLAIVLALLLLFAAALRRWGGALGFTAIQRNPGTKTMVVLESTLLDSRHRLVRVKAGSREHLIVLGGASPVVVESKNSEGNA